MTKFSKTVTDFIYRALADKRFFFLSLAAFIFNTVWLALSAYSLPFDEYYHLGIIKFYTHHLSPFISSQPTNVSYLGDITRLPSYLYEYLMSFPYRFFSIFTSNAYALTVLMRGVNIALVVIGLILWRKLLLKIGVSQRITHLVLFVFMMLPLVVLVASESNYDNMIFLLSPILFGFAFDLARGSITFKNLIIYISVGLTGCLVKSQFLVVFGLTSILAGVIILRRHKLKVVYAKFIKSLKACSRSTLLFLIILLGLSFGLFVERYGYNLVHYHSVNIDCAQVQSFEVCYQYSPWQRNYNTVRDKTSDKLFGNPASYTINWTTTMMRGFVANYTNVPSHAQASDPYGNYEFMPLLPLMISIGYIVLVLTLVGLVVNFKKWWRVMWLRYSLILSSSYIAVLWFFNYVGYLHTGQPYAIQPRYIYPILILLMASSAKIIATTISSRQVKAWLTIAVILIYLYSGGAIGWFLYANTGWYWPNQTNIRINQDIQSGLRKFVLHDHLD